MSSEATILVVKGDSDEAENVARLLREQYQVIGPEEPDDALARTDESVDLIISELHASRFDGLELLRAVRDRQQQVAFVAIAESGDVTGAVEAMKMGAAECLVKPIEPEKLGATVAQLVEHPRPQGERVWPHGQSEPGRSRIDIPPGTSLEDLERAAVEQALAQHNGNRTHAARTLGISVRTLQRKLKAWGMPVQHSPQGGGNNSFLLPSHNRAEPQATFGAPAHHTH